jgi:CSLREA domain-containing protein
VRSRARRVAFEIGALVGAAIALALVVTPPAFAQSVNYSYDSLNRLTQVVYADGTSITYTYDASGNRLTKTVIVPCTFTLGATSATKPAVAGTGTVDVTSSAGCAWTAVSNSGFITVSAGATGTGPGTVTYSLTANTTTSARVGTLTIAGATFTVTQSAPPIVPTVSTTAVTAITKTTAASGGTISDDGGAAVTTRGVCWATTANPTIAGTCTSNGTGIGAFTSALTGLTAATTYHVRAYATNSVGTAYGSNLTFTMRPLAPTTITVNDVADSMAVDGNCTLREAVQASNTDDAIDACPAGNGADTIVLPAGTYVLAIAGRNEDANATGDLDILDAVTLTGAGAATTVVNGAQLDRVVEIGPGIAVHLSGLTIRNGSSYPYRGGGVYSRGTATMTNVVVTANTAGGSGGGGIAHDGPLTLTGSTVSANNSNNGGGIEASANLTLQESVVTGNTAGGGGGGGLAFIGAQLVIVNSTVKNNTTSGSGGGFYAAGTTLLDRSAVTGNAATFVGAGILNNGTLSIVNSTLSGNASGNGNGAGGGGIFNNGSLTVASSTIYGNSAAVDGGGILNQGSATVRKSIVAGNTANNCSGTAVISSGYNLSSDNSCALNGTGDISSTPALVGALADNGGPTDTHALLNGSPAINAAGPGCAPPATDQRGVSRPQGAACDIGAYEREQANTPPTFTPPANITTPATSGSGAVVTFTANGNDAEDGPIVAVCAPASGSTFPLGATTVSCTVTDSDGATVSGSFTVTVTAARAQMTIPTPGTQLIASAVRFQWAAGVSATEYRLEIGTTPDSSDLYSQAVGTGLAVTVTGLPHNSAPLYVRLGSRVGGEWQYNTYAYTASKSYVPWLGLGSAGPQRSPDAPAPGSVAEPVVLAELVSPRPASFLEQATARFEWTSGRRVSLYAITVGTAPGRDDVFAGYVGSDRVSTVENVPLDGRPVFVRLWSLTDTGWEFKDYLYLTVSQ